MSEQQENASEWVNNKKMPVNKCTTRRCQWMSEQIEDASEWVHAQQEDASDWVHSIM